MANKKRVALYAGSFDPFTNGHLDIVERATQLFDQVVLLIAISPNKKPFIELEKRYEILTQLFAKNSAVQVDKWQGLTVDYAREKDIGIIVRGLRPTGDFDSEFQMASMNKSLRPEIETIFLASHEKLSYISSSLVKEVFGHGGNVEAFVPQTVWEHMQSLKG